MEMERSMYGSEQDVTRGGASGWILRRVRSNLSFFLLIPGYHHHLLFLRGVGLVSTCST